MIDAQAFRSAPAARALLGRIRELVRGPVSLMEVCGTHTVSISRFGLRSLMPGDLKLLSGPGCPVCVTPLEEIDWAIGAARLPGVILATFGDMMRVPGSESSLERERAEGHDVRIVYSPLDALKIAEGSPGEEVVFAGVGFETTSPAVAATVAAAAERGISNFSVIACFKRVPPALEALAAMPGRKIDGFICPGHVSTIIGAGAYERVAAKHNIPCVVTGFEPLDILQGITMLLTQVDGIRQRGEAARVEIQYRRAVTMEGNPSALGMLSRVLETRDAAWRAIGTIPQSGHGFCDRYRAFDAGERLKVELPPTAEASGCICGEIMMGLKLPPDCPLFGGRCTPRDPVGPCMVSSEGSCAAFHKYEMIREA